VNSGKEITMTAKATMLAAGMVINNPNRKEHEDLNLTVAALEAIADIRGSSRRARL
jgi:hypothetical protein